ncbi:olfactory receptor-like protein DTMT [Lepisosteus oculatus]|uniref:olfactory receptor-like protein DTMT n=1 Tax=Lepisosteus oculatus TaxID=7918 RepID=UPI003721CD2F
MNFSIIFLSGTKQITVGFLISGFQNLQHSDYYFIFLAFIYLATLIANIILMSVIWLSECLHTPKYMAVFNLSVVDLSISTALIPKCIHQFLFDLRLVLYESCLAQLFFVHSFYALESLSLVVMSYERLVSICFPLRSSTISTNTRMFIIIVFCWVLTFSYFILVLMFIARLSFCRPVPLIKSYFCDHGPVFKEACSSYSANWTIAMDTDSRILNTSLAATLPPLLNPIIYTLKTEEVMEQIKNFLRKQKPAPVIV